MSFTHALGGNPVISFLNRKIFQNDFIIDKIYFHQILTNNHTYWMDSRQEHSGKDNLLFKRQLDKLQCFGRMCNISTLSKSLCVFAGNSIIYFSKMIQIYTDNCEFSIFIILTCQLIMIINLCSSVLSVREYFWFIITNINLKSWRLDFIYWINWR